jgi:DNA polymerase-3 subunit epsilon
MNAFTYFDVETPNRKNDRISSLGIIHVVDGITVHEGIYLVNPEVPFDRFNIELTGITPAMVKDKPTLGALWPQISCYFTDAIIVAHNATFDLGVLTKTLVQYGFPLPTFRYICTMDKAKRNLKFKRNSLDYLCATLGILMERHHEALSDARACQGIFYYLVERCGLTDDEVSIFRMRYDHINPRVTPGRPYDNSMRSALQRVESESNNPMTHDISPTDNIQFKGKVFCLTGDFNFGSKIDVELWLMARGGRCIETLSPVVDYVLVGTKGSKRWAYGSYGTKVKRAMDMKAAGQPIEILRESEVIK